MTYSNSHPVRLVAGRLALDFVNTADWDALGNVVHEKIVDHNDLRHWAEAVDLSQAALPQSVEEAKALRSAIRSRFIPTTDKVEIPGPFHFEFDDRNELGNFPLIDIIAVSAFAILADRRERDRVKVCPGDNCGWLFIDETRNSRRQWCSMETCGNRAKAARHYARSKQERCG